MKRLAIGVLALAVWVAGSALGAIGGTAPAVARSGIVVGKAHAAYTPSLDGKDPITILAVGSGARPGEDVLHSLADSLHVIFIDPATHKASIIGIPRDSYVPIEGHGTGKINSSLFLGGPELLVKTVEQLGGIQIDYWAITTFWGFTDMIDDVGGLTMNVPFAMSDSYARADFQPGVQELSGRDALALARTRHDLQQGDFARQENGGRLFLAALAQFKKEYKANQAALFTWLGAGMRNTDLTLSLNEVIDLAQTATYISVAKVQNIVLPGSAQMVGSLSVVVLDVARAKAIFTDAKADAVVSKKNIPPSPTADET
jgi:LCP family protein required for cell wall assembly